MANRHDVQKKARGGHAEPPLGGGNKDVGKEAFSHKNTPGKASGGKVAYDGEKSNVVKAARKKATGGAVELKASGGATAPRLDKRARGGGTGWKGNIWSSAKKGK